MDKNRDKSQKNHSMHDMEHSEHDHSMHGMEHSEHDHSMHDMDHSEHDHSMHGMGNLKQKFIISLFLAIPILFLSPMMGINLPFQFSFPGSNWVVLILSIILFFYGGMPFLKGAKMEIEMKNPGMMTLIALGISVSFVYSIYSFIINTFYHPTVHIMDFFWELASLILIMLLGHWIEMNAIASAGNALEKIAALLPSSAIKIEDDGSQTTLPLNEILINNIVLVKSGENVPVDGIIIEGQTTINESMITGESLSIKKDVNDKVIGGSVNGMGVIKVKVTGTGDSGYLSQVMKLVSDAQKDKSKNELLSNRVAKWLFYVALIVGFITFVAWVTITKDFNLALERMVTVFIIACPHALGLAIPLVVARSTSIAAQHGLLVKNRQAFEQTYKIDTVFLDKTGTLTEGNFKINHIGTLSKTVSEKDLLSLFASLESSSSHPLAQAIMQEVSKENIHFNEANDIHSIPGLGMRGMLMNQEILITNEKYLMDNNISYDAPLFRDISKEGNSISFLLKEGLLMGYIAQGDSIKESSFNFIKKLHEMNINPIMLTGDNDGFASTVAKQLSIKTYYSELMPHDKEKIVQEYKSNGHSIMMVGDGINDAPSLARADIGVAIGAGTDVAIDSADIVLVKSDPNDIINLIHLGNSTSKKMIQNLWWGAGYNILAIPLAAGILASFGIILSPSFGAILMSFSTVIVAINALLLKIK